MLLFMGSTPVGGYLTGVMAEQFGVAQAIVIEAGLCLFGLLAGLAYYAVKRDAVVASDHVALPAS
jgi:hypothetical protein